MSFNGAGTFTRLYSWVQQAGLGTKIRSDLMDTDSNDIASGLSNVICKDGQTTITANIPFNNKKITGLGAGTLAADAAQLQQVQSGQVNWVAAGGTADALTATLTPAITSLTDGIICYVRAASANATTAPTFAPNGLTAHTITKNGGQALVAGDIFGAGHELELRYNLANTRWELANPSVTAVTVSDATLSTTDITTNNVSSSKHGFAPKSPANAAQFLNGGATPGYASVTDANLSVSDVTTNNVSTSAHGFAPKAPNDGTKYLDGTGVYSAPAGAAAGLTAIASGTLSSGSPSLVDITSIPQTYRALVLYVNGASNTVASRALVVRPNAGGGLGTDATALTQIANATPTSANGGQFLWNTVTQTAAQVSSCVINFPAYQSGPIKSYNGFVNTDATAGAEWATSTNNISVNGVIITSANASQTGALTGLRITWDVVSTGVFDGGTYALYGVN